MNLPKTALQFIFHFVKHQYWKFSILIFTSFTWALNDSIFPYFLKRIVNSLQLQAGGPPQNVYKAVQGTLILLITFWVIQEIGARIQGFSVILTFPQFRANIRKAVFDYVKHHSHEYFSNQFAGNISQKLADLPTSAQTVVEIMCFQFATVIVGAISVFIMMWFTQPLFAGILVLWLTFHITVTVLFIRKSNELWEVHSASQTILSGKIVDVFANILNVRLFARGQYEGQYLDQYQSDEIRKSKKAILSIEIMRIFLGLNAMFLIFGMIFALLYSYSRQWVTLGDFTQVGMQSFWMLGWVWFISYQLTVFAREMGTINNALTLIRKGHDLVDRKEALPIQIRQGRIEFKQVDFAYKKNRYIFKNLNVLIPAGQKVGLVGFSGSGKSTFVNLILRFYDLQAGQILIDDKDIAFVTQDSLRSQIAMIPQDPSLFHRSLMENIRYGRLEASDEEVTRASKLAHCHEFIEKLDEGYESLVGERGIKLSGGQRQRIAIARAILKNAPILILDEATSSLDSLTEKLIQESLHGLMQGRTTIVVAHRLSTLSDMDRIIVFHKGEIIEDGPRETLLAIKGGHFARLWNMQMDGFLPDGSSHAEA